MVGGIPGHQSNQDRDTCCFETVPDQVESSSIGRVVFLVQAVTVHGITEKAKHVPFSIPEWLVKHHNHFVHNTKPKPVNRPTFPIGEWRRELNVLTFQDPQRTRKNNPVRYNRFPVVKMDYRLLLTRIRRIIRYLRDDTICVNI